MCVNQWLTLGMDQLLRALQLMKDAEQNLEKVVAAERAMGKSWANIGERLGVTRQAAFKRFGKATDILTGELMTARSTDHLAELAETFLTRVSTGDEELAMGMLHPSVRKELPWPLISETWNRALAEVGSLESITEVFVTHPGGTAPIDDPVSLSQGKTLGIAVVVAQLNHEAGELMGRIAFDQDDAIVGILYLPADAPADSFPF